MKEKIYRVITCNWDGTQTEDEVKALCRVHAASIIHGMILDHEKVRFYQVTNKNSLTDGWVQVDKYECRDSFYFKKKI